MTSSLLALLLSVAAVLPGISPTPTSVPPSKFSAPPHVPATASRKSDQFSLSIPSIGLDAYIDSEGLGVDRTQIVPTSKNHASWYKLGPLPGQPGSAVVAGHYKWIYGPAVFYRLRRLHQGDYVHVTLESGRRLQFVVEDVSVYTRENFPISKVYLGDAVPRLNLVTCHGALDPETDDYTHRLVVYSRLVSSR